ncbi:hypothetical protein C3942_20125 [Solimonas fluminis]|uniref:Uncharacterized protein n=1 Tax=Solimonas fluminis TaxID=2086571 RepID=A0A2S5TB76_9GAMM|nr:hypothetical protein [Solimonas fluminis]PPE72196.1 hypothetical protein C3942_20125 [Solimonas fluminis]
MAALIERLADGGRGLWLDYGAYASRLLAGGHVPWTDADAAIGWLRKAQGLLGSDVVTLPVREVAAAWLQMRPELSGAMAARPRAAHALKTLLADEVLRAQLASLATALRSSFGAQALVLALPSPCHWVALAHGQAHPGASVEVDADAVDDAAVHIADFLRRFADCGLDGVLLEESRESASALAESLPLYQPLLNVAAHYRWDAGLLMPADASVAGVEGLDFLVASEPAAGSVPGLRIPDSFWQGGQAPPRPDGGFRYAEIPGKAHPESVLERLASLR